ncbi:WXG100 family type VII secretion target [Nocardia neocaledoniensis]|jgi:WXG100 family type VII secretion target|uniref:WXG100 family type VII secretion target n=1 Tax=Nocardia neocaledoniensis TaxID=236511 RepID=A0A317NFA6_9NOCA|nr:WXG100 family type VII secretion target [Nocardia neocaledoniensis]PWV73447.1 WXG100 family type VII secretion target [Nocardia neocaledoniensis]GEM30004.1 ESAT-6-like protein [Nocardia neocaledoniensis NBRC 108232]
MASGIDAAGALGIIPDDVQSFGREAYRIAEELRSASSSLDTEVQGLMSTWKGAAADSYLTGWDEMHRGALDVWDTLFVLAEKLGITAENFRISDGDHAAVISLLDLP